MIYLYKTLTNEFCLVEADNILIADKIAATKLNLKLSIAVPSPNIYFRDLSKLIVSVLNEENVVKKNGKYFLNLKQFHYNPSNVWNWVQWLTDPSQLSKLYRDFGYDNLFLKINGDYYVKLNKQEILK